MRPGPSLIAAFVLATSGCLDFLERAPGASTGLNGPQRLVSYFEMGTHIHEGVITHQSGLMTENETRVPLPTACVATRNGRADPSDSCAVQPYESFPGDSSLAADRAWVLEVRFRVHVGPDGRPVDDSFVRGAYAVETSGRVVATWDGSVHPEAAYATE